MSDKIKQLGKIFSEMVDNSSEFNARWKNLALAPQAFDLMTQDLPLRVKGELTPYTRICLLNNMMETLNERDVPRFSLKVRKYQLSMFPLVEDSDAEEDGEMEDKVTEDDIKAQIARLEDYLNPRMSMEEYCKKYGVHLKFDPVERSEGWEKVIYEVEKRIYSGEPYRMGDCFGYWSRKTAALAQYGIEWRSPSIMNPRVMFD